MRRKRWFLLISLVTVICLAIVTVIVLYLLSNMSFRMVYQDCAGVAFNLPGHVVDASGQPIEAAAIRLTVLMKSLGDENLIVETHSDAQGDFQVSGYAFACAFFTIEVNASGYQTGTIGGDVWQTLPPESREFVITLESE